MPESPGLYLRLSVAENLECFAGLYQAPGPDDRIDRALRAVSLAGRATMPAAPCPKARASGPPWPGRCCPARRCCSPGLDPAAARDVHELIDELSRSGVTIFLTTHRLEEAGRLCDRVAILSTTPRTIGRPGELRGRLLPGHSRPGPSPRSPARAGHAERAGESPAGAGGSLFWAAPGR